MTTRPGTKYVGRFAPIKTDKYEITGIAILPEQSHVLAITLIRSKFPGEVRTLWIDQHDDVCAALEAFCP